MNTASTSTASATPPSSSAPGTQILYTDVDGTLVGPLGNLFWTDDRAPTLAAAGALLRAAEEGLEIVLVSGRSRVQMFEVSRLLGLSTWFCELGAFRMYQRGSEIVTDYGAHTGNGRPIDTMRPVMDRLIEQFKGRLEPHDPWNEWREASLMLRGSVSTTKARTWLISQGLDQFGLVDNGVIPRQYEGLPGIEQVHAYHLAPLGISKRAAIAADQRLRGLAPRQCAIVGDSLADLECATEVRRCFIVHNAITKDPDMADAVAATPNAVVTNKGHTEGFAEAVASLLD